MKRFLPGFKTSCLIVGALFMFLSLSLFGKGLIAGMAEFKVPESTLQSPHYYDALMWVYVHMLVLGCIILSMGYAVTEVRKQKWIALLLFTVTACYTYLDFRSSDSMLGNGLYKGEASLFPAVISLLVCLLFLQLSFRLFRQEIR